MTQQQPPTLRNYMDAWVRVAEQIGPVWARIAEAARPLAELAQSPAGQALIAAHQAEQDRRRAERDCHCLCAHNHPGRALCRGSVHERDLQHLRIDSPVLGEVDVPMCPPCAAARQPPKFAQPVAGA